MGMQSIVRMNMGLHHYYPLRKTTYSFILVKLKGDVYKILCFSLQS